MRIGLWRNPWWAWCAVATGSAAVSAFVTVGIVNANEGIAADARVYELNIYHASAGKARALETRFQDASELLARHGLNVVGYWVPYDDPAWKDTFIYLVAHDSRAAADRNWKAFHDDPQFQKYVKAEDTERLIESVDTVYMRASEYSKLQ